MALVLLDRDGVINEDLGRHVTSVDEWQAIPGSLEAITRLNRAGLRVVIVTNQSGIARRLYDVETLNAIHAKMLAQLANLGGIVEAIIFCPHQDRDQCECRKPKPGMLLEAASRMRADISQTRFIGDNERDITAALAAGARPVLVRTGHGSDTERSLTEPVATFDDLSAAADWLIELDSSA